MMNPIKAFVNILNPLKLPEIPMLPKHGPTLFIREMAEPKQSIISRSSKAMTKAAMKKMIMNRNKWFDTAEIVSLGTSFLLSFAILTMLACRRV